MECNHLFNRKGEKVDNLNNVRFSHNSIHVVIGHPLIINGYILDLIDIFCHYISPKLVLITWIFISTRNCCLVSSDNSSTYLSSSIYLTWSILWCEKWGRLTPETNSMACWISRVSGSLSIKSSEKTVKNTVITGLTSERIRVLSLGEISVNFVVTGIVSGGPGVLNSSIITRDLFFRVRVF